jgi:Flp pilus assembly pilin Flp
MRIHHPSRLWEKEILTMRQVFSRLWKDEDGIVALEYLLVATIIGLGLIAGITAVRQAIVTELVELAAAITNINQAYSYSGFSVCIAQTGGGQAIDSVPSITLGPVDPIPYTVAVDFCAPASLTGGPQTP